MPHRPQGVAHPLITQVIAPMAFLATPVQPGVVAAGSEDQGFKLMHSTSVKEGKVQATLIAFVKNQPQGVFGALLGPPVPAALDANATVFLKTRAVIGVNQFNRSRTFPGHSR